MVGYKQIRQSSRRSRWSLTWWWEEIVSIIASIGFMVAVVSILSIMQDKPIDHWTFFISLNATIAIFITGAKSTAMLSVAACIGQSKWAYFTTKKRKLADIDVIEGAARGPLGSLIMLAKIPWNVATLGALVTILALGIDTFAQQVISNEAIAEWVDDGTASFGLARDYFGGARRSPRATDFWMADLYTVDNSMQGAVLKAFYELEMLAIFNCGSNCSWDQSHISLGFDASCTNVTEATYATQNCTTNDPNLSRNCTMTTPGNVTFSTRIVRTTWSTVLVTKAKSLYPKTLGFYRDGDPVPRLPATFIRLAAFRQPSEYRSFDDAVEQTLECDISLSAYNYTKASSIANKFSIDGIEKIPLDDGYSFLNASSDEILEIENTDEGDFYSYILFNTTGLPEFRVRTLDMGALIDYFISQSFSGTLADGESVPEFAAGITVAIRNPQKNISQILESMAITMTDQLRSSYNAVAGGLTARTVVLVRVQWAWLTLPVGVVLASGLFLIAEMIESRRTTYVRLWKSTATSLLFHSVSEAEEIMRPEIPGPEQLDKKVKATSVMLLKSPRHSDPVPLNRLTPDGRERDPSTSVD